MRLERLKYSARNCSVAGTLAIVGERWSLLILREAFNGIHRFDDFLTAIGCARNILSDRLTTLVEGEILVKVPYRGEGQRERYAYRLTERGLELFPILVALMHWGDRWLDHKKGVPAIIQHKECGEPIFVDIKCGKGHGGLTARDTRAIPGPGARLTKSRR